MGTHINRGGRVQSRPSVRIMVAGGRCRAGVNARGEKIHEKNGPGGGRGAGKRGERVRPTELIK